MAATPKSSATSKRIVKNVSTSFQMVLFNAATHCLRATNGQSENTPDLHLASTPFLSPDSVDFTTLQRTCSATNLRSSCLKKWLPLARSALPLVPVTEKKASGKSERFYQSIGLSTFAS